MTKHSSGETINQGGASRPTSDEAAAEFEIAGNAGQKGEKPSPGERERGETSTADSAAGSDLDTTRDRAS